MIIPLEDSRTLPSTFSYLNLYFGNWSISSLVAPSYSHISKTSRELNEQNLIKMQERNTKKMNQIDNFKFRRYSQQFYTQFSFCELTSRGDKYQTISKITKARKIIIINNEYLFTWSATKYKIASMHGKQQQTAIPIRHVTTIQINKITIPKAKNVIYSLQSITNLHIHLKTVDNLENSLNQMLYLSIKIN